MTNFDWTSSGVPGSPIQWKYHVADVTNGPQKPLPVSVRHIEIWRISTELASGGRRQSDSIETSCCRREKRPMKITSGSNQLPSSYYEDLIHSFLPCLAFHDKRYSRIKWSMTYRWSHAGFSYSLLPLFRVCRRSSCKLQPHQSCYYAGHAGSSQPRPCHEECLTCAKNRQSKLRSTCVGNKTDVFHFQSLDGMS